MTKHRRAGRLLEGLLALLLVGSMLGPVEAQAPRPKPAIAGAPASQAEVRQLRLQIRALRQDLARAAGRVAQAETQVRELRSLSGGQAESLQRLAEGQRRLTWGLGITGLLGLLLFFAGRRRGTALAAPPEAVLARLRPVSDELPGLESRLRSLEQRGD